MRDAHSPHLPRVGRRNEKCVVFTPHSSTQIQFLFFALEQMTAGPKICGLRDAYQCLNRETRSETGREYKCCPLRSQPKIPLAGAGPARLTDRTDL